MMPEIPRTRRRILFLASFAGCPRVWRMASTLAESGYHVSILEWDRSSRLPASEQVGKIRVRRMRLRASYGSRLILKLPIWWIYVFLFVLLSRHCIIQPQNLDNLLPVLAARRIRKTKLVYDIADVYADSFLPQNMIWMRKLVSSLESTLTGMTDATIIVDESRIGEIRLARSPEIIYNSPPDRHDELSSSVSNKRSRHSVFKILYAGILAGDRGLSTMIQAVRDLNNVELTVAGFGAMEDWFSGRIRGIPKIRFLGKIAYEKVLELSYLSDCILALYDPKIPINLFASPNKLFEAMMCGKPIIVSKKTSMAKKVLRERCGLIVDYDDISGLKKAITFLEANKGLRTLMGRNGRRAYLEKYSGSLMEERLLRLYCGLTGRARS